MTARCVVCGKPAIVEVASIIAPGGRSEVQNYCASHAPGVSLDTHEGLVFAIEENLKPMRGTEAIRVRFWCELGREELREGMRCDLNERGFADVAYLSSSANPYERATIVCSVPTGCGSQLDAQYWVEQLLSACAASGSKCTAVACEVHEKGDAKSK